MKKILVTDSLFIFDEHVKKLADAGYEVERLDTPHASEEELVKAIKGKTGYILGGIEKISDKVIEAAEEGLVIAFTGIDYKFFIPGWESAKAKGIKIANTPGANSSAVSEYAVATGLMMQRQLQILGKPGDVTFRTTESFQGSSVGIIGSGKIGTKIARIMNALSSGSIKYYSRSRHDEIEKEGAVYSELNNLLETSDVIFVAVPDSAGELVGADKVAVIKENTLVISISSTKIINMDALLVRLKQGTIRVAIDWPAPNKEYDNLSAEVWHNSNDHTAYNTHQASQLASDMAVESILNLLNKGEDKNRVV